jgi:hypothetical protein
MVWAAFWAIFSPNSPGHPAQHFHRAVSSHCSAETPVRLCMQSSRRHNPARGRFSISPLTQGLEFTPRGKDPLFFPPFCIRVEFFSPTVDLGQQSSPLIWKTWWLSRFCSLPPSVGGPRYLCMYVGTYCQVCTYVQHLKECLLFNGSINVAQSPVRKPIHTCLPSLSVERRFYSSRSGRLRLPLISN